MSASLLEALRAAVGAGQVLTEGDLSAYELDWRKRWRGKALNHSLQKPSWRAGCCGP